jgi:YesN/AraC family two-component response regulator
VKYAIINLRILSRGGVRLKKYSFLVKLFSAFTLLVIIPVSIIYIISDRVMLSNSENAIGGSCIDNLKTADKVMQQFRGALYKDCFYLSTNPTVTGINNFDAAPDALGGDDFVNISHVVETMTRMVQSDSSYYSIYLMFGDYKYIFTSDSGLIALSSSTDTDWLKAYNEYKEKNTHLSFTNTRRLKVSDVPNTNIYITSYIYPITPYTSTQSGAIVVNINEYALNRMINGSISSKNSNVEIIRKNGEVVSDIDKSMLCKNISQKDYVKRILQSGRSSGFFVSNVGAAKMLVSYYKSDMNDWIYIGKSPISELMNKQNAIQLNTLIIALLVMVLGIMAAFFITRKIYAPLGTMVKTIKSKKLISLDENEDEMQIILKAVNTIGREDYQGQDKINKKLIERSVIGILTDGYQDNENKEILDEYFRFGRFTCVVIEMDNYNDSSENYEEKQWQYIKKLMIGIAEELMGQKFRCIGSSLRKGEICLTINFDCGQDEDATEKIRAVTEQFRGEINKILDNDITIGIGTCRAELAGVSESFTEAQEAVRQKLKLGYGHTIVWEKSFEAGVYYYPFETEEQIRNFLETNKKPELIAKVNELFDIMRSRSKLSCENINQIITQLVGNTIIKYMIEHYISSADVFGAETNLYAEFARLETLDEIRDALTARYSALLEYADMTRNRKKTVDVIEEYINNNYKRDIGINDISEYLGMSYSYVRKVFKAEKGTNIVDCINSKRIREARTLLEEKNLSIKSIASLVGYNNNQSFERYFKRTVGITPADYRIKMQNKGGAQKPAQP